MKRINDQLVLVGVLVSISLVFYVVHFAIFHDVYNVFFYGIMDIAFTPISVLLVTLVINRMLSERERRALLNKLDMVIGVFFSEVGTRLLQEFAGLDSNLPKYGADLRISGKWKDRQFTDEIKRLENRQYQIDVRRGDLGGLKTFLHEKRGFLLRLLENPNLLEHESFTELLLAVMHVGEELDYRSELANLPSTDSAHLSGDVRRAYNLLIREWMTYLNHLRANYPYLYSLAIRTNPFDPEARVVVTE